MTPEAQRVAIAEACGWKRDDVCDCWRKPSEGKFAVAFRNGSHQHRQLPDHRSDLNAMHEAEKVLTEEQRDEYAAMLIITAGTGHVFDIAHLTAAQRAEAFLRALGKWEEDV